MLPVAGVWCVVVAGGSGSRFGAAKQFLMLGDSRVLDHSIEAAKTVCDGVVVVLPMAALDGGGDITEECGPGMADLVVPGGSTRAASAQAGIEVVPESAEVILVHDAARPLASRDLFEQVASAVRGGASVVVPVVPVPDTIRNAVGEVVDREELRAVQTPQGFSAAVLRRAHSDEAGSQEDRSLATDDAALAQELGESVVMIPGETGNLKITQPTDLLVAEALLTAGAD